MENQDPNLIRRRLEALEGQLQFHEEERRRLETLLAQMAAVVESQQQANQHLEERLQGQKARVEAAERSVADILNSRIWWLLAKAGGVALRVVGRPVERVPKPLPEPPAQTLETPVATMSPDSAIPVRAGQSMTTRPRLSVEEWADRLRQAASGLPPLDAGPPRISLLTPTWNTQPAWLAEAAASVFAQTCGEWEWCLVDDGSTDRAFFPLLELLAELTPRIRVERREKGGGISAATNDALRMARGEYVGCFDHDDTLLPDAVEKCLALLDEGYDAVYTDSDKIDEEGQSSEPFYKPDWSPEYLQGAMYVGHLLVVRRVATLELGGFRAEFDGVQDFEFLLRYSDRFPRVGHVSEILYHWRKVVGSVAASQDAKGDKLGRLQQQAVQEQLSRGQLPSRAEPGLYPHRVRVTPLPRSSFPKISIIIPTKNAAPVLEQCLRSIYGLSTYPNYEVLLADNDTSEADALEVMRRFPVRRLFLPGPFHFSRFNNVAARETDGEFLLFANNDVEVITPDWLEQMLYYAEQPQIGTAGALLVYPNQTVQHAGVVLGSRGTADHVARGLPGDSDGYAGSLSCAHEVSAVTAACLMIRREKFELAGGFSEHYFTAYQDVELCLRLRERGWSNIFTPWARLVHHESYSRGAYYDMVDRYLLLDQWEEQIQAGDPYFNRHFDLEKLDYTLA